jgi:prepilin peptidase CpaA
MPNGLILAALPLLLLAAAATSATKSTTPNWLSVAIVGAFFCLAPLILGHAIAQNVIVAFAVLAAGFGLYALSWARAGDVKLAAATALWLGPSGAMQLFAFAIPAAVGLSLAQRAARRTRLGLDGRAEVVSSPLPYGVAIAAAGLAAFPQSTVFQAAVGAPAPLAL